MILFFISFLEYDYYDLVLLLFVVCNVVKYSLALFFKLVDICYDWEIMLELGVKVNVLLGNEFVFVFVFEMMLVMGL